MINVTRSSMPSYDEYCEEIKELWESRWLTNMGVKHQKLESDLKKYLNCANITLYTNGHLALEHVLGAFDFVKGSEIITTPFTFASTTHAIARNGLIPVFADVKPDDYTIDPESVESLITEKTVAIVPVHVYGNICAVEKLQQIADKYNLKLIYDAAHAFGVTYNGISSACFGDVSMFSFHATKVFHTIEGGALCYKDESLSPILNAYKNFGATPEGETPYIGANAKMSEFAAAMGICNLRHIDGEIQKRKAVVERYRQNLARISGIVLCKEQEDVKSNYAYFPVVFDGYKKNRDDVFMQLKDNEIIARKYFYPLTNSFECYRDLQKNDETKTPIAQHIASKVLTLPLYADLLLDDVDRICEIITK